MAFRTSFINMPIQLDLNLTLIHKKTGAYMDIEII